jgi:hypothetical protein
MWAGAARPLHPWDAARITPADALVGMWAGAASASGILRGSHPLTGHQGSCGYAGKLRALLAKETYLILNGPKGKLRTGAPFSLDGKLHLRMPRAKQAGSEVPSTLAGPLSLGLETLPLGWMVHSSTRV